MPLHILAGIAACGGLLLITPRLRQQIHHLRIVYHVTHAEDRARRERIAAEVFAREVAERLDRQRRETGARLIVSHDESGGTHYDIMPVNQRTGQPRIQPLQAPFHTSHVPLDLQPTEPQPIAYRVAITGYANARRVPVTVHCGSFGKPTPLPVCSDPINPYRPDTTGNSSNGGHVA